MEIIKEVLANTLMITSFVLVMMLLIEFINVYTQGKFEHTLRKQKHLQIIIAALLGLIPGCLGTYTAVSLFTHNILSKGALVATMTATSGDEAFFMLSLIPKETLIISAILFITAIIFGYLTDILFQKKKAIPNSHNLDIHESSEPKNIFDFSQLSHNFKNISFARTILLTGILLFIFALATGTFSHSHDIPEVTHSCDNHDHSHNHGDSSIGWVEITMLIASIIGIICISFVNEHFMNEHLWEHIIKKHALKTLCWTFAALSLIEVFNHYFSGSELEQYKGITLIIIAALVGMIPESGPHLVFVSLFISGQIPLSVLVTNSIVQDGHGSLPLFAESKKNFIVVKTINLIAGIIIGIILWQLGH